MLQAVNLAPFELRITGMQLLTEDVNFEAEPVSVVLPPAAVDYQCKPTTISLKGNNEHVCVYFLLMADTNTLSLHCRYTPRERAFESYRILYDSFGVKELL